jgi:O-antigen ligase
MTKVKESFIYNLLAAFFALLSDMVDNSFLSVIAGRVWGWFKRQYMRSFAHIAAEWDSVLDNKFEESIFGSFLTLIFTLPARILEGSYIGDILKKPASALTVPLLGLTLCVLFSVPYDNWNNYYALYMSGAVILLMFLSRDRWVSFGHIGFWPVIFALLIFGSAFWSRNTSESLRFFVFALICVLAVIACVSTLNSEKRMMTMMLFIALGLLISCGYGIYQNIQGIEPNPHYTDLTANANMPGRVYSFFDNPNSFANIPVLFSPLMLALVIYSPKLRQKLLFALIFAISTMCLLMTYTRGAWLAWAFSLFILVLMWRPKLAPWLVVFGIACVPLLPASIFDRIMTIFTSDSSMKSRGPIYMAILRLIKRNAALGVGLGSTTLREVVVKDNFYTGSAYFVHGHNLLLQLWGESGIFALVSWFFAMFFPIKKALRAGARKADDKSMIARGVSAGAVAGLIGSIIFGLTDYIWSYPRIMIMYWFLFGIMLAAVKLRAGEKTEGENCNDR